MLLEQRRFVGHKGAWYNVYTGTLGFGYYPYVLQPLDWNDAGISGVSAYPADGELSSITPDQKIKVLNLLRSKCNQIAGNFVTISNPIGSTSTEIARVDRGIIKTVPPVGSVGDAEILRGIADSLTQMTFVLWPYQIQQSRPYDKGDEYLGPTSGALQFNEDVHWSAWFHGHPDFHFYNGTSWGTKNRMGANGSSYPYSRALDQYSSAGVDIDDAVVTPFEDPETEEIKYSSGGFPGSDNIGFFLFTGREWGFSSGSLLFLGRQMPNQHLSGVVNIATGVWPSGYEDFKGLRVWASYDFNVDSVSLGYLSAPYFGVGLPSSANYATGRVSGSVNGSWAMVEYGPDLVAHEFTVASGGNNHFYGSSGMVLFKPDFEYHVDVPKLGPAVSSGTPGGFEVDFRGGIAYINLGMGADGVTQGFVGFSPWTQRGVDFTGFGAVMDLAFMGDSSQFEVLYETSVTDMPVDISALYDQAYAWVLESYDEDGELVMYDILSDDVEYLVVPDVDWHLNPRIKQVIGAEIIADVVPVFAGGAMDRHRYRVDLYHISQKGAFTEGRYMITGEPFNVVEVFDDGGGEELPNRVLISDSTKSITINYGSVVDDGWYVPGLEREYLVDYNTNQEYLLRDFGAFRDATTRDLVNDVEISFESFDAETRLYERRVDGVLVEHRGYPGSPFFKQKISPISYVSESNFTRGASVGQIAYKYVTKAGLSLLQSRSGPGWVWQDFDDYGRMTKRIDQLGSNAFPTSMAPWPDTGGNHTTEITYDGNTQTTVTSSAGIVTGRSWRVWSGLTQVSDYVATDLSASDYSAASNLKISTLYYSGNDAAAGSEPWAVKSIVYPDQTASIYDYNYNTATKQRTVTVSTGKPNSASSPASITAGTQTVTITNGQGYVISSITKDIPSNVVLSSAIVPSGELDAFGRPTRINYLDGTHITRTYYPDFRGLVQSETDGNGVTSTYTYDLLNRLTQVSRDDVITTISNNGLTTTSTSASSSGSRSTSSTVNLSGELQSAFNTFEPATTTSVIHDAGKFISTTTETASGRTIIETKYEDGSLESIRGTGTEHYRYEYGIETFAGSAPYALSNAVVYTGKSLSFTKQIQLTDAGGDSGRYVKTYTDGAGRTVVEETASGTGTGAAYRFSYYNEKGQLWALMDPDGVVTLFGYDEQGAQTAVATDVNKNGIIDAVAGQEDEVVSTTTTYASGQATTITQVGHGGSIQEVSRSITTIASGATTVTRNGNDNLATTITPDISNKKVTVSGADGSVVYEYDHNGQPDAYTVKDATGTTLKTADYDHDKFGRLTATTGTAAEATFSTTFNADGTFAAATTTATGLPSQSLSVAYSNPGGNRRIELTNNGKTQAVEFSAKGDLIERSGFGTFDMELTHDLGTEGTTTTLTTPTSGATTTFSLNAAGVTTGKTFTEANPGPSMGYSSGGLPTSLTTPEGANATYGYGTNGVERGLVKTITYPVNTNTANVALDYDEQGRVTSITDASGTRTLTYDKGQLDTETYTAGPLSGLVIDRSLDTRERRNGLTLANGAEMLYGVSYGYHGNTSALENVTKGNWSSKYTYEADTRLIDEIVQKRGETTVLTTNRDYDGYKRLYSITSAAGSSSTVSYTYHYNGAGQRDTITRENGDYWDISYQGDGQLGTAVKKNSANEAYPGYNYAYNFTGIGTRSKIAINDTVSMDREADYDSNALNQVEEREVPGFVDVLGSIAPLADVTVDVRNQASPVAKKGVWAASVAGGGFNGANYLLDSNAEKGRKWVDYSLIVTPGTYSVEMIWSASPANAAAVPVIIHAGDVRKTQVVNQQTNGGTWVSVGTYTMATGGRLSVRIANMGTTGQVIADAVRIRRTTDTWVQVLDSEDADLVTTLTAEKLGDIFHLAVPVDNSAGPVAAKFDITGTLAGAGENGTDAVASFETSAIIPPAVAALDHDLDGRRKDDWKWIYTWNAAGQLRSVETTAAYINVGEPHLKLVFDYDAQGRRFSKKVYRDGATTPSETLYFIYDGWNLIAELDENLSVIRSYTWGHDISQTYQGAGGIGGLLSIHVGTTATYFPTYDGSGNITGLIDAETGNTVATYEYAPFGEPVRVSGPAAKVSPFGFSTKYADKETGFCYYGHRYYDPELGHWISREPLGEMESANLYAFCGNDPINNYDFLGLAKRLSAPVLIDDPSGFFDFFANEVYSLGAIGSYLRYIGNESLELADRTDSPWVAGIAGFGGNTSSLVSGILTPGTYGEGAERLGARLGEVKTLQEESGDAHSTRTTMMYGLTYWNIGSIMRGYDGRDELYGHELNWEQRSLSIIGGASSTVTIAAPAGVTLNMARTSGGRAQLGLMLTPRPINWSFNLSSWKLVGPASVRTRHGPSGELTSAFAKIESGNIGQGTLTNASSREFARRLGNATDDAGHAVGNNLGGLGGVRAGNIFPQAPSINRGAFAQFEQLIARRVLAGDEVFVRIVPLYRAGSTRPFAILYQARINGVTFSRTFKNP